MYCGTKSHEVFDCEKVKYISQRKKNSEQLGSSVTVVWEKDKRPLLAWVKDHAITAMQDTLS